MTFGLNFVRRPAALTAAGVLLCLLTAAVLVLPARAAGPAPEAADAPRAERRTQPSPPEEDTVYLAIPCAREELLPRYHACAEAYPELKPEEVVLRVNIGLDKPFYADVQTIEAPADVAVLVNKYSALPADYVPALVRLDWTLGGGYLRQEAADAFAAMAAAAAADGIALRSVSAYRSYATQTTLFRRYTGESGQALADTFSARAGHSEHQTGLALDINTASSSARFENTPAYAWLIAHCAEYGFMLRYPDGRQDVTGYRFEPWHYRYVGVEIAKLCMEQELTLEEYIAQQPGTPDEPGGSRFLRVSAPQAQPVQPLPTSGGETAYTVRPGDTLSAIAKTVYGDMMRYKDIFARNTDRLKSADDIYPGQVLILPAQ